MLIVVGIAGFSFIFLGKPQNNQPEGQVLGATSSANQEESKPSEDNLLIKTAQAASLEDQEQGEHKPFEYEVEGGDTLLGIAQKYNLKLETILWANNLTEKSVIKPGQILTLIPVDGVLHTVQKGNTISEIASVYKADTQKIIDYNGLSDVTNIHAGDVVIVPDGKPLPTSPAPKGNGKIAKGTPWMQVAAGSLLWPTTHRNVSQGYSAAHRGLDIANGGKPIIIAAQSGKVEFAGSDGPWGNTIVIRGNDGLVTRYSHNSENYVKTGDDVTAGETIGKVGNTGNVRGKTGLHVDFRVYKNGVAINPKSVTK
jgi:murein DD-endopeptidase MepM/ murein hydrolase activator NlpD